MVANGHETNYCFDTSIFIDGMKKRYPPSVFGSIWNYVDKLISEARILAPEEVWEEIQRQDDEVKNWFKGRRQVFIREDEPTQRNVAAIMAQFPGFAAAGNERACADPFVIGMAQAHGLVVVSQEELVLKHKLTKPKIPNVCRAFKIDCLNMVKFLERERIKL